MSFLSSLMNALPGAAAQGLAWGIMAIGVYITFRILDVADLTVDGSLATGGAVCVMLIRGGFNPWIALLCAMLAGMLAGLVTGLFHTRCGIPAILAGILTQLALYSINLRIMDSKANQALSVDKYPLLLSQRYVREFSMNNPLPLLLLFTAAVIAILYWFFGTEKGSSLRATGANPHMARAQGINTNSNIVLGLMVSNGLVALSGALLAQYQGSSDINMGRGAIVIGLAAVIIGEVIFGKIFTNFGLTLLAVSIGAIIYYIVLQIVLQLGLNTNDLKLITALIVAVFLAIPYWKSKMFRRKPESDAERRRLRHRHRRQRRGQVHDAQRHRRHVLCRLRQGHHRRLRRHEPARAQARGIHRPRVPGPDDGHRPLNVDRREPRSRRPPRPAPRSFLGRDERRKGAVPRAARRSRPRP